MKKFFTLLLCTVMIVTFMPAMAWAEAPQQLAETDNTEGYDWTVTLEKNQFEKDGVNYKKFGVSKIQWLVTVSKNAEKVIIPDTINGEKVETVSLKLAEAKITTDTLIIGENIADFREDIQKRIVVNKDLVIRSEKWLEEGIRGTDYYFDIDLYKDASVYIPAKANMDSLMDKFRGADFSIGIYEDASLQNRVLKKNAAAFDYFCVGTPEQSVGEYVTQDYMTYYVDDTSAELCFTDEAYYESDKKTEIVIPDTIEGKPVTAIGYRAFAVGGGALEWAPKSISIPGTVKTVGERLRQDCLVLKKL